MALQIVARAMMIRFMIISSGDVRADRSLDRRTRTIAANHVRVSRAIG
jgi:hypothetical protein